MNPVRSLRASAGLSQRQLAARAGTSQPTIAAYESGRKSPTLRTLEHLAESVGRDVVVTLVPPLTREDRSLWLHHAIAAKLRADPDAALERARRNLARMAAVHPGAAPLLREWRRILRRPIPDIVDVLLDPRPHARDLRQVTPFAGLLPARERADVYASFRRHEGRRE